MSNTMIDCRGPIAYPGIKVICTNDGVQAMAFDFPISGEHQISSKAKWIAPDRNKYTEVNNLALFRQVFELDEEPELVIAQISADPAFRLYVNGQLCARGPDDIGHDFPWGVNDKFSISTKNWLCVKRDLTLFFRKGRNVIAVEVLNFQRIGANLTSGTMGFWFNAEITDTTGKRYELSSDAGWSAATADYFYFPARNPSPDKNHFSATELAVLGDAGKNMLVYLAGREPVEWRSSGTLSEGWHPVGILPDRKMSLSQIPPCMEVSYPWQEVRNLSEGVEIQAGHGEAPRILFNKDGFLTLKTDKVIPAYLGLSVNGEDDAELNFSMEELKGDANLTARCLLRNGRNEFEFPGYGSCTYLRIEAKNVRKGIAIEDLRLVFTSQPLEFKGSFECDDTELNRKREASRHTLQICMQTHHLDSPHHQEPISDPGDYLIEALINYYTFGSPWLVRQDIRKFAQVLETVNFQNFHTSYALLWLQMLLDYHDYTGDEATVLETAQVAHKLLDTFAGWVGKNGLVCNAPDYMFMDWVEIAGFPGHHPPAVIGMGYLSAFYYRALANGMRIAEMQGDAKLAGKYRDLRTSLKDAFNGVLWDEKAGLYRDGVPFVSEVPPQDPWLPADKDIVTHTPHVNSLAVSYGLAPEEQKNPIMEKVMQISEPDIQPYFMHFVFNALHEAGLFEKHALKLISRWEIISETGTFFEMWGSGDLSHAWNGTLLYQMSSRILGVTPVEPGFAEFAVSPQPCGLEYAKGKVPTPHGIIEVEWKNINGKVVITRLIHPAKCRLSGTVKGSLKKHKGKKT